MKVTNDKVSFTRIEFDALVLALQSVEKLLGNERTLELNDDVWCAYKIIYDILNKELKPNNELFEF